MIDKGMLDYVMARIRFQIQLDGGDVVVTSIDDDEGIVYVALQGACIDCPLSALTLSQGIERVLVEHVPGVKHVRPDVDETDALKQILFGIDDIDDNDDDDDDENTDASDRFGDPVRIKRIDEDGNITESSMPLSR